MLGGFRRRRRSAASPAATAARTTAPNPAAAACLPRPVRSASPADVPVAPPDQEVPAAGVWPVPEATPAAAAASASSREEGGSSLVASEAGAAPPSDEAVSPAGRPLADSWVVYWMP